MALRAGPKMFLWLVVLSAAPAFTQIQNQLDDGQWTIPAKTYASTRYSTLNLINSPNVQNLKLAWTFSIGTTKGAEAAPLVVNGTMYVVTPFPNILYALDLTKPGAPVKWKYEPHPATASQGVACCVPRPRGGIPARALSVLLESRGPDQPPRRACRLTTFRRRTPHAPKPESGQAGGVGRHAVVDLATVFQAAPANPPRDRLPPAALAELQASLHACGSALRVEGLSVEKLTSLRRMYEPYAYASANIF